MDAPRANEPLPEWEATTPPEPEYVFDQHVQW